MKDKEKRTTKDIICSDTLRYIQQFSAPSLYKEQRKQLYKDIKWLQPERPSDGTRYRIAYNTTNNIRMEIKTGKFIGKKLGMSRTLPNHAIEVLSSQINSKLFGIDAVSLVKGSDITDAYTANFGCRSCMSGVCSNYTKLYESNPDKFQMLKMKANNSEARAIVSLLDNGQYYMDKVYHNNATLQQAMIDYAIKNNWSYYIGGSPTFKDHTSYTELRISNLNYLDGEVPYMDTFVYGDYVSDGTLTISHDYGDLSLTSTTGCLEGGDYITCEDCGDEMEEEEDSYYIAGYGNVCYSCRKSNYFYCNDCEELRNNDDRHYISDMDVNVCDSCSKEYTVCDDCNASFAHTTYLEGADVNVCDSCSDNYEECEECHSYSKDNDYHDLDGDRLCPDCIQMKVEA